MAGDAWISGFTGDVDPPTFTAQDPADAEADVAPDASIYFEIDDDISGVDLSTLNVQVNINGAGAVNAIIGGVVQPSFNGPGTSLVVDGLGYNVTIDPIDNFPSLASVTVTAQVSDFASNAGADSWTFGIEEFVGAVPEVILEECRIASIPGGIIQLDARRSKAADGSVLTFEWKFVQVPLGSIFEADLGIVNPPSIKDLRPDSYSAISFIPDKLGDYLVELIVYAGATPSEVSTALVQVGLSRALCGAGKAPDASFMWSFLSNFWSLVEDRQYFETIWSAQLQLVGAEMIKLWSNDFNKSLDTIQNTVQRRWQHFSLVTDLGGESQRVIVGNTKAGVKGNTGPLGTSTAATTNVFYTRLADDDLGTIDVNYGIEGRIIDINGTGFTISQFYDGSAPGLPWAVHPWGSLPWGGLFNATVIIVDETNVVNGQYNIPYRIPHMIHVPGFDLEEEGVSAGDTLFLEWTRGDTGATAEMPVRIVTVDRERVGFEFTIEVAADGDQPFEHELFRQVVQDLRIVPPSASDLEIAAAAEALIAFVPTGINISQQPFSTFRLKVKAGKIIHNTRKRVNDLYVSIPFLQEEVKEDPEVILRENFDYSLEGGFLVFDSSLFTAAEPAPEALWAECAHIDNTPAIEANFGRLVELSPGDLEETATRAPYLASVKGLWFALTNGPTVANLRLGLQILMGLPFAEARGKILDITNNFSTDTLGKPIGRILAEDVNNEDRGIGVRRFYFFPEDIGLEINPLTGVEYAVGDILPAFAVLSKGIEVTDYVKDPLWWIRTLARNEVKKFFLFRAQIDTETGVFNENDLVFSLNFIRRIKPVYTDVLANVLRSLSDDVMDQFEDDLTGVIRQLFYDNAGHFGGHESTFRNNDYNHQGVVLWRGDSRPFMSRSTQVVKGIVTYQNGADVEATSPDGFQNARARVTGDSDTPTIEGDLLAVWPGRPGAGTLTPMLYELLSLGGVTGPAVLNHAPTAEPETFDLDKPDTGLFNYSLVAGQSGAAASVVTGAGANQKRVEGLTGMSASSVGRILTLSGSGDNDGAFLILGFVTTTTVDVYDLSPGTIPDANNGTISWTESEQMTGSVVRRGVNPKVQGTNLSTTSGAIQLAASTGATFIDDGVQIDDHLIIEAGVNAGEYRIVSIVAQTVPRDYTPSGVPQISQTTVGLVDLDGSNPSLSNQAGQTFRIISPALMRTRVPRAQITNIAGNMYAEVLDPSTGFPFDVFTPGMVGEELLVQEAENLLNNGIYTIVAYSHAGRVQITVGSPQTSDASPQAVLTIRSQYHPGIEKADELAPTEYFSAVVV